MNKTKIEWVKNDDGTQGYTWNPVTGCLHGCEYCYARGIARRFGKKHCDCGNNMIELNYPEASPYPHGFLPTFHRYRLDEPQMVKKPSTVFVGSMTDLFGEWVPDKWIQAVFEACAKAPQHRYIFLTKNPKRYLEFLSVEEKNYWLGATTTCQNTLDKWYDIFEGNKYHKHYPNLFLCIEPMQEQILFLEMSNWVIVGVESGNRKNKVIPEREWIKKISYACEITNTPLFMKDSLKDIWGEPLIQQMPWGVYAV
jgi:protein gp37